MKYKNSEGIALITLIVTIIVIIILTSAIIISLSNSNVIGKASEAKFKTSVKAVIDQFMLYTTSEITKTPTMNIQDINGNAIDFKTTAFDNTSDAILNKLQVVNGKLAIKYNQMTADEIKWASEAGINLLQVSQTQNINFKVANSRINTFKIYGRSVQTGVPLPVSPVSIQSTADSGTLKVVSRRT